MTGCENLFGKPVESAGKIMENIKNELGLWCSIGISENKFLSKMASEMKKPLGITELWRNEIEQMMWPLPVQYMYGVGKQTSQKLKNIGITTIRDLALCDREYIIKKFGKMGAELFQLANGIDESPVAPCADSSMKSIGRSVTLPHDITDLEETKAVLMELSDEVGMAARKYGKKGHTVQISIKYADFKSITRQTTVPPNNLVKQIYSSAVELLQNNWNREPIRLLGISLSGFDGECENKQISMFQQSENDTEIDYEEKFDNLENAISVIRQKYGNSIIKPGTLIKK
jgi:DNA polymerase-4